jgi:cytochrome c peroxidase
MRCTPGRITASSFLSASLITLLAAGAGCSSQPAGQASPATTPPVTTPPATTPSGDTPGSSATPGGSTPSSAALFNVPVVTTPQPAPSAGFVGAGGAVIAPVPQPQGSTITDQPAAIRLGKALFWDAQAGSDGQQACASCHFHAGADNRVVNTVAPGPDGIFAFAGITSAGQTLAPTPGVFITTDDRVGSGGVQNATFIGMSADPTNPVDSCSANLDPTFGANRQVTGRQAPSVFGAVYNSDNFWDGRANHWFNGQNPFGAAGGNVLLKGAASLSSQSVGPALSSVEMSCAGRTFNGPNSLGAKLLARPPLAQQKVDPADSILGPLANPAGNGLLCNGVACTYADLVAGAFGTTAATTAVDNFSSIWGQAVAAYEATLIPDRTPYDLFVQGNTAALTANQQAGLTAFRTKNCNACHAEPEFTDASVGFLAKNGSKNSDGGDQGFHNIGVRPTAEDLGRGGTAGGNVLSLSGDVHDKGAFKTPTLRNVGLTAPYFHNGGAPTLDDVMAFYDGTNLVNNPEKSALIPIKTNPAERTQIVDFLQNGLTDCRVEHSVAPFDHPSLAVANGPSLAAVGAAGDGTACP